MSNWSIGPDGVAQIYSTAPGGTEFYLNMDNPYRGGAYTSRPKAQFNISYGRGSQLPFIANTEPNGLKYFNTTGNPITYASGSKPGRSVRLDVYPEGGKWANRTSHCWRKNPGYLYTDKGIGSGEFTVFIRVHGELGSHQEDVCRIDGFASVDFTLISDREISFGAPEPTSTASYEPISKQEEHSGIMSKAKNIFKKVTGR
jgi:hypothetical protein